MAATSVSTTSTTTIPITNQIPLIALPGDVAVTFLDGSSVKVSREFAGLFEIFKELGEFNDDETDISFEANADFTKRGFENCIRFAELFVTVGEHTLPTFKVPLPFNTSPKNWELSKFNVPTWAVEFFNSLTLSEKFEMFDVVLFLRFPSLLVFLAVVIASYIDCLPEDVRNDTFRLAPENNPTYSEKKKLITLNPWIKDTLNPGMRAPIVLPFKVEASGSSLMTLEERIMKGRDPGPKADMELFRGLALLKMRSSETFTLILKFV